MWSPDGGFYCGVYASGRHLDLEFRQPIYESFKNRCATQHCAHKYALYHCCMFIMGVMIDNGLSLTHILHWIQSASGRLVGITVMVYTAQCFTERFLYFTETHITVPWDPKGFILGRVNFLPRLPHIKRWEVRWRISRALNAFCCCVFELLKCCSQQ